jgi:PAS domain S-box-containing protein
VVTYSSTKQVAAAQYSFALLCAALGLFLRFTLNSTLGSSVPYITFFPAIMLSAWAGGLGPGLVTTLLGAMAARYSLLAPLYSFAAPNLADSLGLALFLSVGIIISVLNQSLKNARAQSVEQVNLLTHEIAERRRADDALRESRERLQLALDAANEGLWDLNVTTGQAYYSPQYFRMLDFEVNEYPSTYQAWLSLLHPDDRPLVDGRRNEQIRQQGGKFDLEYRLRKKGGDYAWVRSRGRATSVAADGTPARLIGTLADITEAKRVEEQLRQAQRLDSIGQLAGGIAHDFNNILTVINGYAAMAQDDLPQDSPLMNNLHEIRAAGERAAQLTQQLLAFGRKQLLRPVVMNLNQVVTDISRML